MQSHTDELFLTTFCTEEPASCIQDTCGVSFGNDVHVPPHSDGEHSHSSDDSITRARERKSHFCKFEYDHQLSVFVPLTTTFLIDRKPALPGTILSQGGLPLERAAFTLGDQGLLLRIPRYQVGVDALSMSSCGGCGTIMLIVTL